MNWWKDLKMKHRNEVIASGNSIMEAFLEFERGRIRGRMGNRGAVK